jgi:FAD/FMN-containing dehydrogenase
MRTTSAPLRRRGARGTVSIPHLRARFAERVIRPGDADYDQARTVSSPLIDRRPAAIITPIDAGEVAAVIALARKGGLELAVRSGGHSPAGHSVSEGGIVLDLSLMKALEIAPHRRRAWAETGLTAGEVTAAAGAHGLAIGFGDTGSVGIGGLTLGGGIGYLVRKHGLTIDDLLAAEVVTADGQLLRVDAEHHPDLFWALRGGGGNFGVVTRFHYRLHPLTMVTAGTLILPATAPIIASFIAAAETAPDELSTIADIRPAPPAPSFPHELRGRLVLIATLVHAGSGEEGERALAPFRVLARPLLDTLRPLPYRELYPHRQRTGRRPPPAVHTMFLDTIDEPVAGQILEHLHASSAEFPAAQLRVLGGALARVPVDATAFAHRRSRIMLNLLATHTDPDEALVHRAWLTQVAAALRQADAGAYVNFLADEDQARVRQAYPGRTWERLAAIKRRWDPTNLFHLNPDSAAASTETSTSNRRLPDTA